MTPTSTSLLVLLFGVAAVVPVAVAALWWRCRSAVRRQRVLAAVAVVLLVLTGQLAAVAGVAVAVNRQLGFLPEWSDVAVVLTQGPGGALDALGLGTDPGLHPFTREQKRLLLRQGWAPDQVQPPSGQGSYRDYNIAGKTSHLRDEVVVWVPQGYEERGKMAHLPVVMVLSGAYQSVSRFIETTHFAEAAEPLVKAGKVPPFLAVFPQVNVALPVDTECIDGAGGVRAYSWLAHDIRSWAVEKLGVSADRASWSVEGVSLGGYCAAKIHASLPQDYHAGASVMGYFEPEPDATTGSLGSMLAADPALRQASSVSWLVRNQQQPGLLALLALSSPTDPQSYPPYQAFQRAVRGAPGVTFLSLPDQPHHNSTLAADQKYVLPFLLRAR